MNSAAQSSRVGSEKKKKKAQNTGKKSEDGNGEVYPFSKQNLGQWLANSIPMVQGMGYIPS